MIITISNFRNIKELEDLELDDHKINFLSGISGTGKTAIARAIEGNIDELDTRVGSDVSTSIKCNPAPNSVDVFDNETVEDLYVENQSSTAFNVVMLKDDRYKEAENKFYKSIEALMHYEPQIRDRYRKYSIIIEQTKAKFKIDGNLTAACSPSKAEQAVNNSSVERKKLVKDRGGRHLAWIYEGTKTDEWNSKEKVCPFCLEPIKDERINFINSVASDDEKDITKVITLSDVLLANDMDYGDLFNYDNIHKAIIMLKDANEARGAFSRLIRIIDYASYGIRHQCKLSIDEIKDSEYFNEIPGLQEVIAKLEKSDRELREAFGVLYSEFEKTIRINTNKINSYLERLDIPYRFKLKDLGDDDKAAYSLIHIDSSDDKDFKTKLSYGEKNIISLLLFLLKSRNDDELIIIDDPVSSYDEYRRVQIYRMLFELNLPNMILVMSHDHVFAKYALFFRDKSLRKRRKGVDMSLFEIACAERTGRIVYLENTNGVLNAYDLKSEDYGNLQDHIKNRLTSSYASIRQMIINLRMYMETISHADGIEHATYGYLSVLLHYRLGNDAEQVVKEFFKRCDYTEKNILEWIKKETDIDFPLFEDINPSELVDNTNLCQYELLIDMRESVKDPSLKDELSDMVHLNTALVYCLNPYKHIPCSNKAKRLLASQSEEQAF